MKVTFEDALRAGLAVGALAAVVFLAVFMNSEVAAGALIGLLGLAGSWLFRGKVERSTNTEVRPPPH